MPEQQSVSLRLHQKVHTFVLLSELLGLLLKFFVTDWSGEVRSLESLAIIRRGTEEVGAINWGACCYCKKCVSYSLGSWYKLVTLLGSVSVGLTLSSLGPLALRSVKPK